tara:strand:- start:587 stop:1324 length:738 start_codon:yes stop_codon:yes gene_type:complete
MPKTAGTCIKRSLFLLARDILTQAGWDKDDLVDVDEWIVQPDDRTSWHTRGIPPHDPTYHVGTAAREYIIGRISEQAFEQYLKFTSVRNPFDRIASAFDHMNNEKTNIRNGFREWVAENNNVTSEDIPIDDFGLFVKFFYDGRQSGRLLPLFFKPQTEWFTDLDGNKNIDTVIRYENIQEDYEKICDKVGYPKTILPYSDPKFRQASKRHYSSYFADNIGCVEMVQWLYKEDFIQLGYDSKLTYV